MTLVAALRSRLEFWLQVAGLIATAWVVWVTSVGPYWGSGPRLTSLILSGLETAFWALAWSGVIALALRLVMRRLTRADLPTTTLRESAVAVWFAPATILLLQFSTFGLVTGLVVTVTAAHLFCIPGRKSPFEEPPPVFQPPLATVIGAGELPVDPLSRHFQVALLVAAGFQVAMIAALIRWALPAAAFLGISTAMLTAAAVSLGAWRQDRPANLPRSALALALTVLLALMAHWGLGGWGGGFGFGSGSGDEKDQSPRASNSGPAAAEQSESRPDLATPMEGNVPGSYAGVIIWPEVKPVTTLVAPPPTGKGDLMSPTHPLAIPFGGEYWMYRWPFRRPPENSYLRRGTPASLSFRTTDHLPLTMEARQKLTQAISLRCCRNMQVAILNADRYPGTVSLEVILADGLHPDSEPETLGTVAVNSIPDPAPERTTPMRETLDFHFPSSPRLKEFDEIRVVFHRAATRLDKSARISIERFVLQPM